MQQAGESGNPVILPELIEKLLETFVKRPLFSPYFSQVCRDGVYTDFIDV